MDIARIGGDLTSSAVWILRNADIARIAVRDKRFACKQTARHVARGGAYYDFRAVATVKASVACIALNRNCADGNEI